MGRRAGSGWVVSRSVLVICLVMQIDLDVSDVDGRGNCASSATVHCSVRRAI